MKLTPAKKRRVATICRTCVMRGQGMSTILAKVKRALGPMAKRLTDVALKEYVKPYIDKRLSGKGLKLAGKGRKRKTLYY